MISRNEFITVGMYVSLWFPAILIMSIAFPMDFIFKTFTILSGAMTEDLGDGVDIILRGVVRWVVRFRRFRRFSKFCRRYCGGYSYRWASGVLQGGLSNNWTSRR